MFKASKTYCALDSFKLKFLELNPCQAIPQKFRELYKPETQTEALTNF